VLRYLFESIESMVNSRDGVGECQSVVISHYCRCWNYSNIRKTENSSEVCKQMIYLVNRVYHGRKYSYEGVYEWLVCVGLDLIEFSSLSANNRTSAIS
jgi:ribosomal protein S19